MFCCRKSTQVVCEQEEKTHSDDHENLKNGIHNSEDVISYHIVEFEKSSCDEFISVELIEDSDSIKKNSGNEEIIMTNANLDVEKDDEIIGTGCSAEVISNNEVSSMNFLFTYARKKT